MIKEKREINKNWTKEEKEFMDNCCKSVYVKLCKLGHEGKLEEAKKEYEEIEKYRQIIDEKGEEMHRKIDAFKERVEKEFDLRRKKLEELEEINRLQGLRLQEFVLSILAQYKELQGKRDLKENIEESLNRVVAELERKKA